MLKGLKLTHEAAQKICEKHGHREAAQAVVESLNNYSSLTPSEIIELVDAQKLLFAESLVKSIESANEAAIKVEHLPVRAEQGQALRDIRKAMEELRRLFQRHWKMVEPLLEIETAQQLAKLVTPESARALLPAALRSEFDLSSSGKNENIEAQIMLGYLLEAGPRPQIRLIKGAKIAVRVAQKKIAAGAPIKDPLAMALVLAFAKHYEVSLCKKATWSADGPFSKFCVEVAAAIGLPTKDSWEHVLRAALNIHRSSFVIRRWHEPRDKSRNEQARPQKRKPRKQQLTRLRTRKTI